MSQHNNIERLVHVIKDNEPIVESKGKVWELEVVGGGVWQMLVVADRIVRSVANNATREWREFWEPCRLKRFHATLELGQWIGAFKCLGVAATSDSNGSAKCHESHECFCAKEAVAAYLLSPNHALKEAAALTGIDSCERRKGCESVGE